MTDATKKWGDEEFWGVGFDYDPQWLLTPAQRELQTEIIELSRTTLRENAVESDKNLIFPRKNFEALASLGLLGLLVSKELGGIARHDLSNGPGAGRCDRRLLLVDPCGP